MDTYTNPYSPPDSESAPIVSSFRWSVIPASLIGLLGAASFGFGTFAISMVAFFPNSNGNRSFDMALITAFALYLLFGFLWIASGVFVWKQNYRYAIASALIGLSIPVIIVCVSGF